MMCTEQMFEPFLLIITILATNCPNCVWSGSCILQAWEEGKTGWEKRTSKVLIL